MPTSDAPQPYVLGTDADELARLGLQHRLWADAAYAAWRRAGITAGMRVMDVGCGPGFAAFDLAQIVGASGAVVGVDESANFITFLNQQAQYRALPQLSGVVADVQKLEEKLSGQAAFDLAYLRWVLCFVSDPPAMIRGVGTQLKRGAHVVIHDYFNYASMTCGPRRASHDKAVAATFKSWAMRGGDPDICGRAPRLLAEAGFEVTHIDVHTRIARGGDTMFLWPYVWWHTFAPKLVEKGLLMQGDCDALFADLEEIKASKTDFIQCPPVYEIIAVKV